MQKMKPVFPCFWKMSQILKSPLIRRFLGHLEMNNEYNIHKCKQSAIRVATNFSVGHYTVPSVEHGPKMFLLFSPLIDEKISSFLTYLKSW